MYKKLFIIFAGMTIIIALEIAGFKAQYIDEVQQFLKFCISTLLASESGIEITKVIKQLTQSKNADSSNTTP